jgi:hypothetical protein
MSVGEDEDDDIPSNKYYKISKAPTVRGSIVKTVLTPQQPNGFLVLGYGGRLWGVEPFLGFTPVNLL